MCVLVAVLGGCAKKEVPVIPEEIAGSCRYENRFSRKFECRDYHGDWTEEQIRQDCDSWGGEVTIGQACNLEQVLGYCIWEQEGRYIRASLPGNDPGACGSTLRGCEFFGRGAFDPAPICGGVDPDQDRGGGLVVFQQPVRRCQDPLPGEPPGRSPGGQVCTWEMISGATEPGRRFADYASCDRVRTQRPYYPVPTAPGADRPDERLQDPEYAQELAWVRSQIESTACVCCHSSSAPRGPSNWYLDAPGNFINGFFDRGIAMGAGWIDTSGLGAYPPEENNGFSRATPDNPHHTIFVTTDDARMRRFFVREAERRGLRQEMFAGMRYVFGPIDEQRLFRPSACTRGEGVTPDGRIVWRGGRARYLYVLEEGAASPTVPPNLDLPAGTIWRIDVPPEGEPWASGTVRYGQVPAGGRQRFPLSGPPAPLVSGRRYYLYVTADILQPVTRCLMVAP
ncbi:MAG: hypothetical protein NZ890_15800 [Myxococcota bacterium]|nr:hypothetical protein [Myxococcota bacterium]